MTKTKIIIYLIFFLSFLGLLDAGFLTYEHYSNALPPCSIHLQLIDCGNVLRSQYSTFLGIPVALFGTVDYLFLMVWIVGYTLSSQKIWLKILVGQAIAGFLISLFFMIVQLFVIKSICLYCTGSALLSTLIFLFALFLLKKDHQITAASL